MMLVLQTACLAMQIVTMVFVWRGLVKAYRVAFQQDAELRKLRSRLESLETHERWQDTEIRMLRNR